MGSLKSFFYSLIFTLCMFDLPFHSVAFVSIDNITLLGDAYFQENGKICLTSSSSPPPPSSIGVGRALYSHPIRFLDPFTNSTASFISRFSFYVTPLSDSSSSPPPSFGDGLTFIITSNPYTVGNAFGYIGLSNQTSQEDGMYIAIEFDTSFDPSFEDISGNHIGIDINSVISFASVDSTSMGFDLKNGKRTTVWVEYIDSKKTMKVWLSYTKSRTIRPILATHIDLTTYLEEFMFIGFSASNGKGGSAKHVVEKWRFRTYGFLPSVDSFDTRVEGGCFMCVPDDVVQNHNAEPPSKRSKKNDLALGLGVGGAALFISIIVIIGGICFFMRKKRIGNMGNVVDQSYGTELNQVPKRISLNDIKQATMEFDPSRVLGEGGSGTVYEGHLASGKEVAVKRFRQIDNVDAHGDPFANELAAVIGCLKHRNLLQLQGWCCEGRELILVYEYMPNRSLDKLLERAGDPSVAKLKWEDRLKIVLGVASALTYLHEECERQIIHRDVKASNIMLDADFNAKLGDFGLAELYERGAATREATIPAGSTGYLAPEYVQSGVPTVKTDVFSFGVVMLVVATGKRPVETDGRTLVDWVWSKWFKGNLVKAADPSLMRRFKKREMEALLIVGLSCVSVNCADRPTVKEAARMLKGEAPLPVLVLPARMPAEVILQDDGVGSDSEVDTSRHSDTTWLTAPSNLS